MERDNLTDEQALLADYMSDISEESHCAGWLNGLEYALWQAVENGPMDYGRSQITEADIKKLKELSKNCNGWIFWCELAGAVFVGIDEWRRMLEYKRRCNHRCLS
jgi:hypothetical protein